jgi:formylmethanofuran dehydrogenase subunit E
VRVAVTTPDDLLNRCVEYHGHLCLGQVLGVRLALAGMELIGTRNSKEMIVFIENERCIADAIQVVTGTRIGRRSAKLVSYGKMAATFLHIDTGAAYRVNVRDVPPRSGPSQEAIRQALYIPAPELLAWRRVEVSVRPEDLPGKPRRVVACTQCGERVFDGLDIAGEAGPLCRACAHGAYYKRGVFI